MTTYEITLRYTPTGGAERFQRMMIEAETDAEAVRTASALVRSRGLDGTESASAGVMAPDRRAVGRAWQEGVRVLAVLVERGVEYIAPVRSVW